jgi:carboxyl-terminal processing protease
MPRWNLAWLLGIAAVTLLGYTVSHSAPIRETDRDYELVKLVVDVLDEVDHKYVRQLDPEAKRKLVEDMVNGGLDRLDPHSTFINARQYKRFSLNSRGEFGGIGVQIEPHADRRGQVMLTVLSPMVDTPAYEAGVQAGDVIVKINGKSTENMDLSDAVDRITGEPGTKVVLSVLHEGAKQPVDLEMARAKIQVPSVLGDVRKSSNPKEWDFVIDKASKIAYIRLVSFSENSETDLRKVLEQLKKDGVHGLVLDLRYNPGGLLRSAVDVSRLFLNDGRIVSTKGRNQREEVYDAKPGAAVLPSAKDCPMAILVNRLSASASEIVAAALQDNERAIVVGERSFGKGSVQNVIEMENHTSALKLTTASYWRPSGKNIHRFPDSKDTDEWGVRPNKGFDITLTDDDRRDYFNFRRLRDVVRNKTFSAAEADAEEGTGNPKSEKDKSKKPFVDRMLDKALEYLRGEIKRTPAQHARSDSARVQATA